MISTEFLQQALNGGPAAEESLRQYLAAHEDPKIRMFAEWAERQRQQQDEQASVVEVQAVVEPDSAMEESGETTRILQRQRRLKRELAFQREIGDTLAAALGACYLCWGDDPACDSCRGEGAPGWGDPDPDLFAEMIVPALKKINKQRKASRANETRQPHPNQTDSTKADSTTQGDNP
ncbi:MAG: hypothetical protein HY820_01515 [Acidobacteria bacterium]|nr:hypothetical protein [Acidobacteriota bacterium]